MWVFVFGLLVGAAVGYALVVRKAKPRFLLHLEYWVYLPGELLPPQDELMTQLVHPTEGKATVGPQEALLFSDVRLHIALVLRSKNGHVFRPDLLAPYVDASPEELSILADARSLVKVRFVSEEPVPDRRYLRFLPQAARVVAELGQGRLVYDPVGERLLAPEALRAGEAGPNVRWIPAASGGHVETLGLKKLGLPEVRTAPIAADERWIVTEIVGQVAAQAWKEGELPSTTLAEAFDDRFRVELRVERDNVATARIHRIQAV